MGLNNLPSTVECVFGRPLVRVRKDTDFLDENFPHKKIRPWKHIDLKVFNENLKTPFIVRNLFFFRRKIFD